LEVQGKQIQEEQIMVEGGYTVLLASDGDRGLETYRRHCEQIDLDLLYLSMPVMSGKEMLEELCTMEVQSKVIVFTGYATDASEMPGVGRVIRKPLRMNELAQAVRAVLDE
jgi:DNA-binding response OmpR family regulator